MTIAQMATYFGILQDKYASPYFTNPEISLLLNRAQVGFVKELLPVNLGKVNAELSKDTISEVAPLIYNLPAISMPSTGLVTKASIQSALTALISTGILWRPLSFGWLYNGRVSALHYVRPNDWNEFQDNYFKLGNAGQPKMVESALDYKILPINTGAKINITVLKYPLTVDIDGGISSDLPDHTHDRIVSMALELAGIGTRDEMLAQLLALRGGNAQTTSHLG